MVSPNAKKANAFPAEKIHNPRAPCAELGGNLISSKRIGGNVIRVTRPPPVQSAKYRVVFAHRMLLSNAAAFMG
jgi:hypothetical protein